MADQPPPVVDAEVVGEGGGEMVLITGHRRRMAVRHRPACPRRPPDLIVRTRGVRVALRPARVNLLLTGSISDGMLLCRYVTMIARV